MYMTKPWFKSKTLWVNGLMVIASVLLLATKEFDLTPLVVQWVLFIYGVVNIVLRTITKEAVNFKR